MVNNLIIMLKTRTRKTMFKELAYIYLITNSRRSIYRVLLASSHIDAGRKVLVLTDACQVTSLQPPHPDQMPSPPRNQSLMKRQVVSMWPAAIQIPHIRCRRSACKEHRALSTTHS